ncbi:MAG: hypothetical protein U9M91_03585 [Chloroflexota bacterium]|nr:hypothetical protein [Chloroflexota bacterium]
MESKRGTIAVLTAAVAAYVEKEGNALRLAVLQRRPVAASTLWSILGVKR